MRKILIITTYYMPDTAISAVRPYMFAKYLSKSGYEITVLRSGEINAKIDNSCSYDIKEVRVLSYLGDQSPAEMYKRGEQISTSSRQSRYSFISGHLREHAVKVYNTIMSFRKFNKLLLRAQDRFEKQKIFLNEMKSNGESFDIVFSTFGELENIYAGKYAAELFGCKYILDFRDLFAQKQLFGFRIWQFFKAKRIQKNGVEAADLVTTVSQSMTEELQRDCPGKNIVTLYNGYEPKEIEDEKTLYAINDKLVICYTGQLYGGMRDLSSLFRAIFENCREGKMEKERICFYYAGKDFGNLKEQAEKYDMDSILVDAGYLERDNTFKLQTESDIFTVLSWNTTKAHGILTGKLYEGIRCKRPILAIVSGNEANSELKTMNEKYNYGFCYEEADDHSDFLVLKEWILELYQLKLSGQMITSQAGSDFYSDFRYDKLSEHLNSMITKFF